MRPLLLVAGACMATTAQAFTILPAAQAPFRSSMPQPAVQDFHPSKPVHSVLSSSVTPIEEVLSDSSLMQAEFFNGMTHALLDFTTLWGGAVITARLATVLGRLFVIGQDVQHDVLPDELVIQLGLLLVACHGLVSTLVPKVKAQFLTPNLMTVQDRHVFRSLFRPAGVSFLNFKELHSESMDWISVEPGHVLFNDTEDDNSVYWLYKGDVKVFSNDKLTHNLSGRQEVAGLGLLGESRLASLGERDTKKQRKPTGLKAVAGDSGATLLRINTTKLQKLLRHDQDLAQAISRLAFMGMQDKLDALLSKSTPPLEELPAALTTRNLTVAF